MLPNAHLSFLSASSTIYNELSYFLSSPIKIKGEQQERDVPVKKVIFMHGHTPHCDLRITLVSTAGQELELI